MNLNKVFLCGNLIDNRDNEKWCPVVGFEGYFDVSNIGRIRRSFDAPRCNSTKPGRLLRPDCTKQGYRRVTLSINNKKHRCMVHRLVARAFLEGFESGRQINHKNGVKSDNRVENLEWCSAREKVIHAWKEGICVPFLGESHWASVLTDQSVKAILVLLSSGVQSRIISKAFGITEAAISAIKRGKTWTHISKGTK